MTFRARQVRFGGGRPAPAASADAGEQHNGVDPEATLPPDGEPAGVSASGADASASAEDLPF